MTTDELVGQLYEDAGGGLGVHERDPVTAVTAARRFVHEAVAGLPAGLESLVQVGNTVAHMMNARAAAGQELRDRAVRCQRVQEFDGHIAQGECDDLRTVDGLRGARYEPEDVTIEGERFIEIRDCDADVRHAGVRKLHGASAMADN